MDGKVDKGKKEMSLKTQRSIIQMKHYFGDLGASSSSNRDIKKGWDLQYVKPQEPTGAVVITKDEWREFQVPKVFMLRNGVFLFDFSNGDANKIPFWIQFLELHLSLWNPESLGKLASYVGIPIATNALTTKRQRVAYARMLVETEIMDTLPHVMPVVGPQGVFQQPVVFEWEPKRCGKCRNLGHEEKNCNAKAKKVWVPKKPVKEQVIKHMVGSKPPLENDELWGAEVQTVANSSNEK
ncbi:hypothetical protein SLEP1_g25697 [Rubroshorea leprosula]|uniref:DUF4283 domain-containing protein n=1 Tax=Rubroshorea leprosula TaxID=152421 RepID=A0AAV5JU70_9ROSI|nr:hypothetical protein SLEP1_g25697 [Rubroshorea leprosula]